jgi:hypothetical protein
MLRQYRVNSVWSVLKMYYQTMNTLVYKLKGGWAETLKRCIVQSSSWYMSTYEINYPYDKNICDTMTKYRSC